MKRNPQAGMTLVEVIAVIVLIGLIIAVVAPNIFGQSENAKAQLNVVKMEKLANALSQYRLQFNSYPEKLEDLMSPSADVKDSGQLFTPLAEDKDLKDVWGTQFIYKTENNRRSYTITTLGSDGARGGDGPAQDVTKRG